MQPLPDPTGFQLTPTLHTHPNDATNPVKNQLKKPFSVVVLGASKGIGFGVAETYAKAGATTIILAARSESITTRAQELKTKYPSSHIVGVSADVATATSMQQLAEQIRQVLGPAGYLDCIVANAAYYGPMTTSVLSGDPSDFSCVLDTNVLGVYHAARYLLPLLLASGDSAKSFIAVSSLGAWMVKGEVAHTAACVSKLAQLRLVQMISEEFREQGILATAVHPGFVLTDMSAVVDEEWRKRESWSKYI